MNKIISFLLCLILPLISYGVYTSVRHNNVDDDLFDTSIINEASDREESLPFVSVSSLDDLSVTSSSNVIASTDSNDEVSYCEEVSGTESNNASTEENSVVPEQSIENQTPSDTETSVAPEPSQEPSTEDSPSGNTGIQVDLDDYTASVMFVYSVDDCEFLFESNAQTSILPASITKLFTALYALEIMPLDYEISPGDELFMLKPNSSVAGLSFSDTYTLEQLIAAMLVPSGNDAAYTVAAAGGRYLTGNQFMSAEEAVGSFMNGVNEYARSVGCTGTYLSVPDGYAYTDNYTTAHDLAIIATLACENSVISSITSMPVYNFTTLNGREMSFRNTNALIHTYSSYYRAEVTGLKTGTLSRCSLLVSAEINEKIYIIGILEASTSQLRFYEASILFDALKDSLK